MKRKLLLTSPLLAIAFVMVLIWKKRTEPVTQFKEVIEISLLTLEGRPFVLDKVHPSGPFVLNFFGTGCDFCSAEIGSLISFAEKHRMPVWLVSADSIHAIREFREQIKTSGLKEGRVLFGQISLEEAEKVFGSRVVPQTILFGPGLRIRALKKGMVSFDYLEKSIE